MLDRITGMAFFQTCQQSSVKPTRAGICSNKKLKEKNHNCTYRER